jgi:hypothetical protein
LVSAIYLFSKASGGARGPAQPFLTKVQPRGNAHKPGTSTATEGDPAGDGLGAFGVDAACRFV